MVQQIHEMLLKDHQPQSTLISAKQPSSIPTIAPAKSRRSLRSRRKLVFNTPIGLIACETFSARTQTFGQDGRKAIREEKESDSFAAVQLIPSPWIIAKAIAVTWWQGLGSCSMRLSTRRIMPFDSMGFEFVTTGNIVGLKKLLERREASLYDIDPQGRTLLHVSLPLDSLCQLHSLS